MPDSKRWRAITATGSGAGSGTALRRFELASPAGERLPAVPATGLMMVVAGAAFIWDPWGLNGYLAVKAATAGAGLALLIVWLVRRSELTLPARLWLAAGIALAGLMVAATANSDSLWRSALGAPLRLEGLLAWASFGAAFLTGFSLRQSRRDGTAATLVDAAAVAVVAVGLIGALELAGVEVDADLVEFRGRVRSTLGNPTVLSSFMILVGPVAAAAAARGGWWRWAGGLAGVLAVINVAAAQTRTVLASAAAVGFVALLLVWRGRRRWAVAAFVLAAGVVALVSGRWQLAGHDLRGRIAIWEVAVAAVADDPLLGTGPETFVASYGEHVGDATVREFGRAAAVDRAHSGVLDFAVSFGLIAGAVYLAVLICVALLALRAMHSGDLFRAVVGFGVACYAIQQQTFFAHPTSDMVWWLMVGILVADSGAARRMPSLVAALVLSAATVLAVNAGSAIHNDRVLERARGSATAVEAFGLLEEAAAHRPFDDLSYILMGDVLTRTSDVNVVRRGIERIRHGVRHNEGNELVALALIDAQTQAYRLTSHGAFASGAHHDAAELIRAQPANGDAYLKRGVAAWHLGDLDAARSDWERAAFLMPDRPEPRENLAVLRAQREYPGAAP